MNALATLETGLLLGLYALLAGIWGVLFALAQLREMSIFRQSAAVAYGLTRLPRSPSSCGRRSGSAGSA
jgi:hypothetical protein